MKIVISGHGKYAEGVYNTLKFFKSDLDNVKVINYSYHFEEDLEDYIKNFEGDDLIVVTDILNGSVNQAAMKLLKNFKFCLVTGVNIAFLLEVLFMDNVQSTDIQEIIEASRQQLVYVNQILKEQNND